MVEIQSFLSSQSQSLPSTRNLEFGRYFTDHWFSARYVEPHGWQDARIEPYGLISLNPAASVFHYGQALFEGMKAYRQPDGSVSLFRPNFNWERMQEGAARICLAAPPKDLFMRGLRDLLRLDQRWVPSDGEGTLYIRPTLIGTEAFLGVRPSREALFYILLSPVGSYYKQSGAPTRIWVEDRALRAAPGGLGATKAGANYVASLQTTEIAKKRGFDQVLWLDSERDGIEEVGTMNVFWVLRDEIVTPALSGTILAGCTRDSVIEILAREGFKVSQRRITMTEILDRHQKGELLEAFGTGTAVVISPIGELHYKDQSIIISPRAEQSVSQRLSRLLTGIQRGILPDPFDWMIPIETLWPQGN